MKEKDARTEPTIKEIVWEIEQHHSSCGDYDVIAPAVREFAAGDAPAALQPVVDSPAGLCIRPAQCAGLVLLSAVVAVLALALRSLRNKRQRPAAAPPKGNPRDVLVLQDYPRSSVVPGPACSQNPSVEQVEAFMRFVGIEYVKKVGSFATRGQLPIIEHGPNKVSGAGQILGYLAATFGPGAEGVLYPPDPKNRAVAVALASMATGMLAHALLYFRWICSENWAANRRLLLVGYRLPRPLEWAARELARKASATKALGLGIGLLSEPEILDAVTEQLEALSTLLGSHPFLFGDSPHAVDAAVFGVLDQYAHGGMNWQLRDAVHKFPNLMKYVQHIRCNYFGPEYVHSLVWLDDTSARAFGQMKEQAREAQCAIHSPPGPRRRKGGGAASRTGEPAEPALFS